MRTTSKQLALWQEGSESVKVTVQNGALLISHRITDESRVRVLTLPLHRGLLIAIREGIDSVLRGGTW